MLCVNVNLRCDRDRKRDHDCKRNRDRKRDRDRKRNRDRKQIGGTFLVRVYNLDIAYVRIWNHY